MKISEKVLMQKAVAKAKTIITLETISSIPPSGKYKVTNIYVDPATNKFVVQYDDTPV